MRIDDETHVGEGVLYLPALVKSHAADNLVGDALAHERIFNRPRLGVGAIENRHHRFHVVGERGPRRARDEVGFLELVVTTVVGDAVAPWRSVQSCLSLRFRFCLMTADAASRITCVER